MNLGKQIHELRKKQNLSQEQLAEKVGVARQTISKWELGETAPDINQAQLLSQIFDVSIDELLGNDAKELSDVAQTTEEKRNKRIPWKRIILASSAAIVLCLVIVGVIDLVKRSQILHPEGTSGNIVITEKTPILIGKGSAEAVVFSEQNKPTVVCELPEGFVANIESPGLYTDGEGNFIKFNAAYSDDVVNPLLGTSYYSYYEEKGYDSYMEMARAAMYNGMPKLGIFSSKEKLYLAGGARLMREQLCAGQNAEHYPIDGGLTESGDAMRIYGFALRFENSTWLITLKDCNDVYYFITVNDPNGIGKTAETVGKLLSTVAVAE